LVNYFSKKKNSVLFSLFFPKKIVKNW
jgi:hypothetical protein